jgi:hypothetical protein
VREESAREIVFAEKQQMQQQLCNISLQVDQVHALLRAHINQAASPSLQPHQPTVAALLPSQSDDRILQHPEPQLFPSSESSIDLQQKTSTPVSSPSIFLQQSKRLPYLQHQDEHQRQHEHQQLKRLIEDVTPRISTLNELFA